MPDPVVHWRDDGTPVSVRFGDIYRNAGQGGLAQARQVFLQGCGLLPGDGAPPRWQGAARWAVLETGFGLGLNFLATWQAWRQTAERPRQLFYSAVDAFVPEPADLRRGAAPFGELAPLADELIAHWHGLLPGVHRLRLDGGRVQLTLAVGDVRPMLAELSGPHDSLFLDGFSPALNPDMWSPHTLKAAARLLRPGAYAATWCVAGEVRERLTACGFEVERVPGVAPKRHALHARYAPHWTPRPRRDAAAPPAAAVQPARCSVIGAGLAGAAVARALALRGWQVTVLDRGAEPAAGASGLPAGVVAPHVSPDDRPLSRLTRAGVRATLASARELLVKGSDYAVSGVLERHAPGERRLPAGWADAMDSEAASADVAPADAEITQEMAALAGAPLDAERLALWHQRAGWLRPGALVRAMLRTPGVDWHGQAAVAHVARAGALWRLTDEAGALLHESELVVIAAGFDSLALLTSAAAPGPALPLHALRGQVALGGMPGGAADGALPTFPVNGHGSLIAHLPSARGPWWISGSSFERGNPRPELRPADHAHNRQRLAELLPAAAAALAERWDAGRVYAWAAVRATLPDRLPAVGAWSPIFDKKHAAASAKSAPAAIDNEASQAQGLPPQLLTGLGARGLTLALLCADLLAAWLHDEPLPVERSLAQRLRAARWCPRPPDVGQP